mmetsp:Transcript_28449/g.51413  ORF Transcript_28449/g.51413 Transcript_28449/m.51413 type:complete len:253 (-) Transcript_28449:995-1753(-)
METLLLTAAARCVKRNPESAMSKASRAGGELKFPAASLSAFAHSPGLSAIGTSVPAARFRAVSRRRPALSCRGCDSPSSACVFDSSLESTFDSALKVAERLLGGISSSHDAGGARICRRFPFSPGSSWKRTTFEFGLSSKIVSLSGFRKSSVAAFAFGKTNVSSSPGPMSPEPGALEDDAELGGSCMTCLVGRASGLRRWKSAITRWRTSSWPSGTVALRDGLHFPLQVPATCNVRPRVKQSTLQTCCCPLT